MNNRYKIIFIEFCLSILIPFSATTQVLDLGIKAGMSISYRDIMTNNKFQPMPSDMHRLAAFTGGLMLNLRIGERWFFHSEVLFADKGLRQITHNDSLMDKQGKMYYANSTERFYTHNYYLHFPQTIRYSIPLNKKNFWSVYFELGGYFAYYLTSKLVWKTTYPDYSTNGVDHYDDVSRWEDFPGVSIHRLNWGGTACLGLLVNLWMGKLDFNIQYDHDIQPYISDQITIADKSFNSKVYLEFLSITIGYSLPVLNKKLKNY
jgi:hypothetical protein